ncbi:MAG: hypothetical protein OXC00_04220 [Acidimicrobiaceae bacterium]|nr:hypothetical protein [Acidimicrobiaceae bacterium]
MTDPTLTVDFAGEVHELSPDHTLEFGRGAELDIDSNPFLHRRVGRFEQRAGYWFLSNIGGSTHLVVIDASTMSQATVAPGREIALTFTPATVRFRAGRATYELLVEGGSTTQSVTAGSTEGALDTLTVSSIPLTMDQRLLVVALAEPTLREPTAGLRIPANREAAARLRWPITKFNRKLDNVCAKLTKAGVSGLHGAPGALASNRRRTLVEFALQTGLVTAGDLTLLEDR